MFDVEPSTPQIIDVTAGETTPTVPFAATLGGSPVLATWSVDVPGIGTVGTGSSASGVFVPTGAVGGLVHVSATEAGQTLTREVFVQLAAGPQNGPTSGSAEAGQIAAGVASLTQGAGVGSVGGEGLGQTYPDFPTTTAAASTIALGFVYPYSGTVWPLGLAAPLLMWSSTPGDADAIQIALATTSGSFSWTGTFGRPAVLGATGSPVTKFVRHPIPQDVWQMATASATGTTLAGAPDALTVSLVVASGGTAYGPVTETWSVASAPLPGVIYYSSYGTALVANSLDQDYNGHEYGAAVLSLTSGAMGPKLAAGTASKVGSGAGCRTCHAVASGGAELIAQHGDNYVTTSAYDLATDDAETVLTGYDSTFGWAGLSPDGSLALTSTAEMAAGTPAASRLYAFPPASGGGGVPIAATGIPSDLLAGAPAFSPDGAHVAFELLGGTVGSVTGTGSGESQLVVMDFGSATTTFSNVRVLATMPGGGSAGGGGGRNAGLPSFFPASDAVVFHDQLANPSAAHRYDTWAGATAQVWWSDLATGDARVLAAANGLLSDGTTSYLPTGASNHDADTTLNYEPTVSPVAAGGYAWVVFTTRRLYGNLATTQPWQSDPRAYDDTQYANVTCKKLWVAAVSLSALASASSGDAGATTDPSFPAFYLPGQELTAANGRGVWASSP